MCLMQKLCLPRKAENDQSTKIGPINYDGLMQANLARVALRPPDGPTAVTGTDVALFEGGLIRSLYVFLDPTGT
jgi:hypothetical protein